MNDFSASQKQGLHGYGDLLDLTSHQRNLLLIRPLLKLDFNKLMHTQEDGSYLLEGIRIQEKAVSELRTQAEQSYQAVIRIVGKSDFIASEGQIAEIFASENLDRACADNEFITGMIADRVAALEGSLEGMVPDFERCVTEIYNQVSSAMSGLLSLIRSRPTAFA